MISDFMSQDNLSLWVALMGSLTTVLSALFVNGSWTVTQKRYAVVAVSILCACVELGLHGALTPFEPEAIARQAFLIFLASQAFYLRFKPTIGRLETASDQATGRVRSGEVL